MKIKSQGDLFMAISYTPLIGIGRAGEILDPKLGFKDEVRSARWLNVAVFLSSAAFIAVAITAFVLVGIYAPAYSVIVLVAAPTLVIPFSSRFISPLLKKVQTHNANGKAYPDTLKLTQQTTAQGRPTPEDLRLIYENHYRFLHEEASAKLKKWEGELLAEVEKDSSSMFITTDNCKKWLLKCQKAETETLTAKVNAAYFVALKKVDASVYKPHPKDVAEQYQRAHKANRFYHSKIQMKLNPNKDQETYSLSDFNALSIEELAEVLATYSISDKDTELKQTPQPPLVLEKAL